MILDGYRFDLMPEGAVAFLSNVNSNPTMNVGSTNRAVIMDISVLSEHTAKAVARQVVTHSTPYYIGALATEDGSEVFWVNNTRPLP